MLLVEAHGVEELRACLVDQTHPFNGRRALLHGEVLLDRSQRLQREARHDDDVRGVHVLRCAGAAGANASHEARKQERGTAHA